MKIFRQDFFLVVEVDDLLEMPIFLCVVRLVYIAVKLQELARAEVEEIHAVIECDDLVERLLHGARLGGKARDVDGRHEEDSAGVVHVTRHEPEAYGVERVARDKVGIHLASCTVRLVHHACDHALVLTFAPLIVRGVCAFLVQLDAAEEHLEHTALVEVADLPIAVLKNGKRKCIPDLR